MSAARSVFGIMAAAALAGVGNRYPDAADFDRHERLRAEADARLRHSDVLIREAAERRMRRNSKRVRIIVPAAAPGMPA